MEYTLEVISESLTTKLSEIVLILVLVEYTLEARYKGAVVDAKLSTSLNPCFSGIYSRRSFKIIAPRYKGGLNPCFSGIYSRRVKLVKLSDNDLPVLILVLVEYTLEVNIKESFKIIAPVLILVLVEYTLEGG